MDSKDRLFVDGIASVRLVDGVIKMTMFNNVPDGKAEKPVHAGELVMSQQAFLRAFGAMENLIKQLADAGLIKRKTADAAASAASATSAASAAGNTASPNFQ